MPCTYLGGTLLLLLALSTGALAVKITLYGGGQCTGVTAEVIVMGPDQGCHQNAAGVATSAFISSTGAVDDSFYVVFFTSDICNPETILDKADEGCVKANYGSFAVWDVCKLGETGYLG